MKKLVVVAVVFGVLSLAHSGISSAVTAPTGTTGGAGPKPSPLVLGALSLTHAKFAVGTQQTFRYTLSGPGTLKLVIRQALRGKLVERRCMKPLRGTAKAKNCIRRVATGLIALPVKQAGTGSVPFTGQIAGKALKVGKYVVTASAVDAAGHYSNSKRVRFEVVAHK